MTKNQKIIAIRQRDKETNRQRDQKIKRRIDKETKREKDQMTKRPKDKKAKRQRDQKTKKPKDKFFIVFAIWEPIMAQSQDRVDGVCDWS